MEAGRHNRGESWIVHPDKPPEEAPGVATHRVRQIRFDDEFAIAGKTLVIKMDVEGSEFHALDGHGAHAAGQCLLSPGRALFGPVRRAQGAVRAAWAIAT